MHKLENYYTLEDLKEKSKKSNAILTLLIEGFQSLNKQDCIKLVGEITFEDCAEAIKNQREDLEDINQAIDRVLQKESELQKLNDEENAKNNEWGERQ